MLTPGSPWITVHHTGITPVFNTYSNQPLMGQVRWNPSVQCLEVYDGYTWLMNRSDATLDLSTEAKEILEWARVRRQQEQQMSEIMSRHPGLQDLHDRFEVMLRLVIQDEQNTER